jgi:hypothetical protein
MDAMNPEIAYVPVPTQWLSEIYQRLAELTSDSPIDSGSEAPPLLDEALVRRIYVESEDQQRRMMRLMAERPDEWRYSKDIAADLELEHKARGLAGMLGAFGRRSKHRYGGTKPWEAEWDSAREENRYWMPAYIAAIILDAAQST